MTEDDDFIETVEELRPEVLLQLLIYQGTNAGVLILFGVATTEFEAKATAPFSITFEPMFEVMMIRVFLKSTVRPLESVRRPSSRSCSSRLKTSGWAFSISSNSTTVYGRRRTASVSCPPR